ncbi:hypothetical protein [Stieleria magnilauensis]|uniref:Uncharacterized protein n=1 Tax=Stieleria magnilauensis TaxID=2527963 RepID=A0ABX5Y1Y7_9BACT|nr:hypothetical protein TBK1r_59680 [Planctomycetes bacterium TBK1r]QDV87019.1 hypothetical protein TBK1r_60460 [Planctomycetes bacterium TBK1r]
MSDAFYKLINDLFSLPFVGFTFAVGVYLLALPIIVFVLYLDSR